MNWYQRFKRDFEFVPNWDLGFELIFWGGDIPYWTLHLGVVFVGFYIPLYFLTPPTGFTPTDMLSPLCYGFSVDRNDWASIHFHWRLNVWIWWTPWGMVQLRREVIEEAPELPFKYVTKEGEEQVALVTCKKERTYWTLRVFRHFPIWTKKEFSLFIDFHKSMGEDVDSWKGGVTAMGARIKKEWSCAQALSKMESAWAAYGGVTNDILQA